MIFIRSSLLTTCISWPRQPSVRRDAHWKNRTILTSSRGLWRRIPAIDPRCQQWNRSDNLLGSHMKRRFRPIKPLLRTRLLGVKIKVRELAFKTYVQAVSEVETIRWLLSWTGRGVQIKTTCDHDLLSLTLEYEPSISTEWFHMYSYHNPYHNNYHAILRRHCHHHWLWKVIKK